MIIQYSSSYLSFFFLMMMSLTYDIPYLQIVLGDLFPKHIVCAKSIEKTEICTGCTIIFSDNSSSYTVSHISCIILMNMYCSVAYTENTMLQTNEMNEKNLIFNHAGFKKIKMRCRQVST